MKRRNALCSVLVCVAMLLGAAAFAQDVSKRPAKPFVAKFHRMGMTDNRENAMAIGAALTGKAG